MKRSQLLTVVVAGVSGALWALPAVAHDGHATTSFLAGFMHPWLGWDHLLAMLAVGLWACQRHGAGLPRAMPMVFAIAVALGLAATRFGLVLPAVEPLVSLSLLVLGSLLLACRALSGPVAAGLLAVSGLLHGQAHGLELPAAMGVLQFGLGLVLATLALHTLGVLAAMGVQHLRRQWLLQVAGAGVAVSGLSALIALAV